MSAHNTLFDIFVMPLNKAGVKYMTTGSVASITYGEPRLTHDIDLVVFLTDDDCCKLCALFPEDRFYLPPAEVVQLEMARASRGHFNIIHLETAYKADIYLLGKDPLLQWGFNNRRDLKFGESHICVATPEYVIVQKLAYWDEGGHAKHIDDILAMLQIQGNAISIEEIQSKLSSAKQQAKFNELIQLK